MTVKVVDPFSAKADLRYSILDSRGRRVAAGRPGKVRAGAGLTVRWTPRARGAYTIVYHATDLGLNKEAARATTRLTVR